ncbi:surfeit locus protein 2 [Myripristis murdjan]|uniref:Surfeit 2 n=1 Tax=Myripristis murdjan TaxID=586833 RepID=A0A667YSB3_9TELE|nr:surfeit locus protein 2 [Myripristis murdjan]
MEDLPADLRAFLSNHPALQLADNNKIKCTLNGHEFPCNLAELQNFTKGKKYQKLSAASDFSYSQYEPHIVPSTKQPGRLFCKLTVRHLNRQPHHVLTHVNGKRFKKALLKYEECMQQGVEFVPARLQQKQPKHSAEEVKRGGTSHRQSNMWEPSSDDEDHSDSEDSMSDLYPPSLFTPKNVEDRSEEDKRQEKDDFLTDEDEEMEVDEHPVHKRKKTQGGGIQKKFKNNHKSRDSKKSGKVRNGK